jgi:two pore calcium channel protein, plant
VWCLVSLSKITSIHELLKFSNEYRLILETITQIVPLLADLFIQVLLLVLFYAVYGVHLFGGLITDKTPAAYEEMLGDNMGKNYEYLSFNDIPNGMLFLYSIMITNDWSKISTQAMVTFKEPLEVFGARLFFLSFFCLGFILVLNTTIGTIIDFINTYLSILQEEQEEEDDSKSEEALPVMQLGSTLFGTSKEEAAEEKRKKAEKKKLEQMAEMLTPLAKKRDNSLAKSIFSDE